MTEYTPQQDVPTDFKYGHHRARLVEVFGENMVQVDWGSHQQCMCSGPPAPVLFKHEDGTWWAARGRRRWEDPKLDRPTKIWFEAQSVKVDPA